MFMFYVLHIDDMDWFYIISGVIGNLVIGGVVIVAYKLTYHYAKKNIGWSGYKRVLLIIGIIILLIILNEYQYIGLLDTGLSKAQKEFIAKIEIKESLYFNLQSDQILLYQHYFNKVLNAVDVNNYTMWAEGKNCDKSKMSIDDKKMQDIITNEASSEGLDPAYLQVMVHQYFFADVWQRESDKNSWVKQVLNRKSTDYFPDSWAVYKLLKSFENK